MDFVTTEFLLFIAPILIGMAFVRNIKRLYPAYIFGVSIYYYSLWNIEMVFYILLTILINYIVLWGIHKTHLKKLFLRIGIVWNIFFWLGLKYVNFFIESAQELLKSIGIEQDPFILNLLIPLGLSFYTFRIISHLVDSYKGEIKELPSFLEFGAFVSFFPQVISGPIAVADKFYKDLKKPKEFEIPEILFLFILGAFKKLVLASILFESATQPFDNPELYSQVDLIIAAFSYTFMLYADFSGYSDMAIAISRAFGIRTDLNFNMPYSSPSLKTFWRRWHITLGRWLKYYIYIPLGGNRNGEIRKYLNLILTFTFAGIWHGAAFGFIIWGFLHGIGLVLNIFIEKGFNKLANTFKFLKSRLMKIPVWILAWFTTLNFVIFSRIYFRAPDVETAHKFIDNLFSSEIIDDVYMDSRILFVMMIILVMNFVEVPLFNKFVEKMNNAPVVFSIPLAVILGFLVINLGPDLVPPFIYFSF